MKSLTETALVLANGSPNVPAIIERSGGNARFAFEEFFKATINNEHTRRACTRAVGRLGQPGPKWGFCTLRSIGFCIASPTRSSHALSCAMREFNEHQDGHQIATRMMADHLRPDLTKEIAGLPARSLRLVCDIVADQKVELHELQGRVQVHRLRDHRLINMAAVRPPGRYRRTSSFRGQIHTLGQMPRAFVDIGTKNRSTE